jgi:hypothetical protein
LDVGTRRERTGIGRKEKREGEGCAARKKREDRARGEWIRRNERNEGKGEGEILSEGGREIGWMKEIWKRRARIEKERGKEWEKNVNFWNCIFVVIRNRKASRANKALYMSVFASFE